MNIRKKIMLLFIIGLSFNSSAQNKTTNKNYFNQGNIFIEYVGHNGGVLLYYFDSNGKKIPVLDTVDFGKSSFIGMLVDKNYFNLKTSGGVSNTYSVTQDFVEIKYNVGKKIELTVTYTVAKDNELNIKYSIKNIDKVKHTVGLKSVFDTLLGEWNGTPFFTEDNKKIDRECIITNFNKNEVLTSTDGVTSIRFLMNNNFDKYVYKTVIAAKSFFETDNFENQFIAGRSFNTVLGYNNACVGFFFKSKKLQPEQEFEFIQKIEFIQIKSNSPNDYPKIVDEIPEFEQEGLETEEIKKSEEILLDNSKLYSYQNNSNDDSENINLDNENLQTSNLENPEPKVQKKEIDKEYVLELIERIRKLEDDGKNTNRLELMRLHAELNEVIKILKN